MRRRVISTFLMEATLKTWAFMNCYGGVANSSSQLTVKSIPARSFGGLLTLTQLAKIDLGVRIEPDLAASDGRKKVVVEHISGCHGSTIPMDAMGSCCTLNLHSQAMSLSFSKNTGLSTLISPTRALRTSFLAKANSRLIAPLVSI